MKFIWNTIFTLFAVACLSLAVSAQQGGGQKPPPKQPPPKIEPKPKDPPKGDTKPKKPEEGAFIVLPKESMYAD